MSNLNSPLEVSGKIRIGAVSYLNTKPMITGLNNWNKIELIVDYPANIAKKLLEGVIDIGLVPVAIIPQMKEHYILTDYGIACDGAVTSVCLFSNVPMESIKTILLDYQSRTSIQLLKILLKEYWKKEVVFENATEDYIEQIKGTTAGLVIGDRAFAQLEQHQYVYDLGSIWKLHTGLPFVFAAWISNKKLDAEFIDLFNQNIKDSLSHFFISPDFEKLQDYQKEYLQHKIHFPLKENYIKGLELFLGKIFTGI